MKINEKNLAAFAASGTQIDREGYLMKKAEGNKNFSKRWFVLKGNLLFYFEKRTDREPIGVIILEGSTIELTECEMEEKYCFKIVFPSRSYILGAESHSLMEQWMKALACASYDYVKLMAAELQRQLDELCRTPDYNAQDLLHASIEVNSNIGGGRAQHHAPGHIPTPPPRHRSAKPPRSTQKRSFANLHEEFGLRIISDQQERWARLGIDNRIRGTSESGQNVTLSVLHESSLI